MYLKFDVMKGRAKILEIFYLSWRHTWRSAKIARCARCSDGDFRRSPRSAYKIADIWHVRYRRLNSPAFAKCTRSRDFLCSSLRIATKVNQSGWAILSHDFSKWRTRTRKMAWMESGNEIEVPNRRDRHKKIAQCVRFNQWRNSLTIFAGDQIHCDRRQYKIARCVVGFRN